MPSYLDKIVDSFQIEQIIVSNIHTNTEVETSVSTVNDFEVAKLNKVSVLGITN